MSQHTNESPKGQTTAILIDEIKKSNLRGLVDEAIGIIKESNSDIRASIIQCPPIIYDIVVLETADKKGVLLVNENAGIPITRISKESHLDLLPDASVILGRDQLNELVQPVEMEYCNINNLHTELLKMYNSLQQEAFGNGNAERLGNNLLREQFVQDNKLHLEISSGGIHTTINNRGHKVTADFLLSHFDMGQTFVMQPVLQTNNIRTIRDLALVLAAVEPRSFYERGPIDLTPLKKAYGIDGDWEPVDVDDLLPYQDLSIDIPRSSDKSITVLLDEIAQGSDEHRIAFLDELTEEIGFDPNYNGKIFMAKDPYPVLYGTITVGDANVKTEDFLLSQILGLKVGGEAVRSFEYGTVMSYADFLNDLNNPTTTVEGILNRYTFDETFISYLKEAVNNSVTFGNENHREQIGESYYKRYLDGNNYALRNTGRRLRH